VEPGEDLQFCCSGCRLAFDVIRDHGLDRFYRLREQTSADGRAAASSGRSYDELDDPRFDELYVGRTREGWAVTELYLEGVHCAACVWLVEKLPSVIDGVAAVRLDLGRSRAVVTWDADRVQLSAVARFLDSIGYPPHPYRGVSTRDLERRQDRSMLIRTGVAGAVAGNVMLLAFALYGGHFYGIDPGHRDLFRWASLVLSLPSVLWCAGVFYRGAFGAVRTRTLHMDVPITIGVLTAVAAGVWNTITGAGEVYFDSVTVLIFLLLVGRQLQRRQQRTAARATELLLALAPSTARVVDGHGGLREVPLEALTPGQVVEVRAGETVPADGEVEDGAASVDSSLLSGEARPVPVAGGDPVHAGTVSVDGRLRIRVHSTGEDTRVGRLLRLVEEGAARRAPVVLLADRLSAWFVAVVLLLAAFTLGLWMLLDPAHAVDHAVALLIVTCPCALGLATPLAVTAAIGQAARRGILIRGGDALEQLAHPARMVLDKTGTVTEGRLALVRWIGETGVQPLVAAAEAHAAHPVAQALAADLGPSPGVDVEVEQVPGRGLRATADGRRVTVGSPSFLEEQCGELPIQWRERLELLVADALTPVLVAVDGEVVAAAGLGDPVRADAAATVAEIRRRGWQVEVLSGDHPEVVRAAAAAVGLPATAARGGVSPEAKLERVRAALGDGRVVMVGDGVNDAAALACASVGIGVRGGAEATLAVADVYLDRPGLSGLAHLLGGATRTLGVIRRNLVLSVAYNVAAVTLAMSGHMHPLLAAILMPISSITVVVSSFKARMFSEPAGNNAGRPGVALL
jgi:Cu2+-exporting ATPase